jgi:UDP-N-acetylmuramoyl-L-alanyl-D-glutamate--2,6-diaminopimelate ligase
MIERLTSDSRNASPGAAFFAWPGETSDGRCHIAQAIERGCAAVLWERDNFNWNDAWRVPNLGVSGLRAQAGRLAHEFYGRPSDALWICAVTGTNGKTSCTQWLAALLGARGTKTGLIGTLGSGFPGALGAAATTTPDALELHATLAALRHRGAAAVALEASSHGLVQGRLGGLALDCALFTNLSHDHLDYHGTMAAYGEAKAALFDFPGLGTAVLNLDDAFGLDLARRLLGRGLRTIGYGLSQASLVRPVTNEWIVAREVRLTDTGARLHLVSSWGEAEASVNQLGRFNAANALGVLGCLVASGIAFADAVPSLASLPAVPGRMQRLGGAGLPLVVVDYAHTPDALDHVLQALRVVAEARRGRLIALFGAGGDRDPTKRPAMGAVAARLADRVVLTSDNPRSEDPLAIIAAIRAGIDSRAGVELRLEVERASAIEGAIETCGDTDVLLVAGKGHEAYQEAAGARLPFSDTAVAQGALARRARAS